MYLWYFVAASHRRRSNTAQRLEKLKREKHKQSKIKHITWKDVCTSGIYLTLSTKCNIKCISWNSTYKSSIIFGGGLSECFLLVLLRKISCQFTIFVFAIDISKLILRSMHKGSSRNLFESNSFSKCLFVFTWKSQKVGTSLRRRN